MPQGGYLVTKDFTTAKSLNAIASFIIYGLDETLPTEAREVCFDWMERCLDVTFAQQQVTTALSAWLKAETKLTVWASALEDGELTLDACANVTART